MQAQDPWFLPCSSLRHLPSPTELHCTFPELSPSALWAHLAIPVGIPGQVPVGTPGYTSGYTWAGTCGHTWGESLPKKWVYPSWKICTFSFWNGVRYDQCSSGLCDPQ